MTQENPSAEHTITMCPGSDDVFRAFFSRVETTLRSAHDGDDYETLAANRLVILEQTWGLLSRLRSLLLANDHDGDIVISRDGPLALYFTYPKSGYSGGFILHEDPNPAMARFAIHT